MPILFGESFRLPEPDWNGGHQRHIPPAPGVLRVVHSAVGFYERSKATRRSLVAKRHPEDHLTPDEHIRDPFVLEFLGLKDEYSEHELEEALIGHLEHFLLELEVEVHLASVSVGEAAEFQI